MVAGLTAGLLLAGSTNAFSQQGECAVTWDDKAALSNIWEKAISTFAVPTTNDMSVATGSKDSNGLMQCKSNGNSAQTNPKCWEYRQTCGRGKLSVWSQYAKHFHLMFEGVDALDVHSSTFYCNDSRGKLGLKKGGQCVVPADWADEKRSAMSMPDDWWEVLLIDDRGALMTFDLETISVSGTTPIQLWFRKTDGSVWGWQELGAGVKWDTSGGASQIVAAWIGAVAGKSESFNIPDFSIRALTRHQVGSCGGKLCSPSYAGRANFAAVPIAAIPAANRRRNAQTNPRTRGSASRKSFHQKSPTRAASRTAPCCTA
jgi:hypothetical protein